MVEFLSGLVENHSGTFNIILSLIIIYQWIDKRSKGKFIEQSLIALKEMSERLNQLSERSAIKEKSADLISVIKAIVSGLNGKNKGE